jgi:uncharacterized phage-associated protein
MPIHISPEKIESVIVYILEKLNRGVKSVELAKYLYLIDIESMRFTGKTITEQPHNRAPQGPLARDFKSSTNRMNGYEIEISVIENVDGNGLDSHFHRIGKKPRFNKDLTKLDIAIINRVLGRYYNKSVGQLKKIAYDTKPWKAILLREEESGESYHGAIDLSVEEKNKDVIEWENNIKEIPDLDESHKQFLRKESAEFNKLISSLI